MDTEFSVSFGLNEDVRLCEAAATACFECIDALELLLSRFNAPFCTSSARWNSDICTKFLNEFLTYSVTSFMISSMPMTSS